jgi:hypothetical protein
MYAKNTTRLQERLDVYWIVHNFVRVHFTTRQGPAVALGILQCGLSLKEIFLTDIEQVLREKKPFILRCMLDGIKKRQGGLSNGPDSR